LPAGLPIPAPIEVVRSPIQALDLLLVGVWIEALR
jgi:hypothetical protein